MAEGLPEMLCDPRWRVAWPQVLGCGAVLIVFCVGSEPSGPRAQVTLPGGPAEGSPGRPVTAAVPRLGRSWDEMPQLLTQPHEDIYRHSGAGRIFTWKFVQIS